MRSESATPPWSPAEDPQQQQQQEVEEEENEAFAEIQRQGGGSASSLLGQRRRGKSSRAGSGGGGQETTSRTTSRTCSNELLNVISIDDDRLRYRHFTQPELQAGTTLANSALICTVLDLPGVGGIRSPGQKSDPTSKSWTNVLGVVN